MPKSNNFISIKIAIAAVLTCISTLPAYADVSGTVYRELPVNGSSLNSYGIREVNESGVSGIDVTITGDNGVTETVQTSANGAWTTTQGTGAFGSQVRVAFSNIPGYLHSSPVNTGSNTTVQFVAEESTNVDLGLHNPADYSATTDPMMGTPRYISGDPLLGGASGTYAGFVGFRHSYSGEGQPGGVGDDSISFATTAQIGSTWGTTYQRSSKTVFVAASYRRHVGLGPLNTSGIYSIDFSSGTPGAVTSWLDINTLGSVDTGTDPRIDGTDLDAVGDVRNYDWRAYPAVGKIAMGDMDISEDDKTLYVVNLNEKTVIPIDVATKSLSGSVISIPDPGCSNGEYRPWGLEHHQGELYVGVVCSAETSQLQSDLTAHVMKLSGGTFSSVFDFSLNYDRGYNYDYSSVQGKDAKWDPWTDDYYGVVVPDGVFPSWSDTQFFSATPQPILADIKFDVDGSMILGFLDRHAFQSGYDTWAPDPTESRTDIREWTMSAGDMLRVCPDGSGGWDLEGNAACGGVGPTSGASTGQGPGDGEFYHGDEFFKSDGSNTHQEVFLGGIAMLPGSGKVATTAFDPIDGIVNAGGVRWLDNASGESIQAYQIYKENYPPEQGKAVGVGDIEIFADPAPLQIGNRVWDDTNGNGVQDAGEPGIEGVDVTLNCGADTATVTTTGGGEYYFDNDPAGVANALFITTNESCTLSIAAGQTELSTYILTTQNADGDSSNDPKTDQRDSDALNNNGVAEITFTVGNAGENNHTLDFGFTDDSVSLTTCDAGSGDFGGTVFRDYNENGTHDLLEPGLAGVTVTAYDAANNPISTATSNAVGDYVLADVADGTDYRIEFTNLPGDVRSGSQGSDSHTTVRFETAGAQCGVDLGVNNPAQYCQVTPEITTSLFRKGDHATGTYNATDALISVNAGWGQYATGNDANPPTSDLDFWQPTGMKPRSLAVMNQLGSTYGLAWSQSSNYLYAAAYQKSHTDFGPGGRGQIYRIEMNPLTGEAEAAPEQWVNIETDLGETVCGGHGVDLNDTYDQAIFDRVGKCSLGDLDISEDESTLFVMNLTTKEVVGIDTATQAKTGQWAFPTNQASCANAPNDVRPFALKFRNGKLYAGGVCSGETGRNKANLRAYVYSLDTTAGTWTPELEYDWSKQRRAWYGTQLDAWMTDVEQAHYRRFAQGSPKNWVTDNSQMLTDIEFVGNDMILGFRGRFSDQWGVEIEYERTTANPVAKADYTANTVGDIVCVGYDVATGSYAWETNDHVNNLGVCGGRTASTPGYIHADTDHDSGAADPKFHDDDLDDGEFYWGDGGAPSLGDARHYEISMGGLAQYGTEPVIMSALTPPNALGVGYDQTAGFVWLDNNNGAPTSAYVVYDKNDAGTFNKASGLGDVEALCLPAPVEVGNRVWLDGNENGIQDPGEAGVDGVNVTLSCGVDTATATTAGGGEYYFDNDPDGTANALFMDFGESCMVSIAGGQAALSAYELTTQNADGDSSNDPGTDLRDSDALDHDGVAEIAFTVGNAGENNHTLDFGYKTAPQVDLELTKTVDKPTVLRGEVVVYTLTVSNTSTNDATGVQVTDKLPTGLEFVGATGDGTYTAVDGLWVVGDLAAGDSAVLIITARVK